MQQQAPIYLGVMSGTSLDGVDIAAVRIADSGPPLQVIAFESKAFPASLRRELVQMIGQPQQSMAVLVAAHKALGHYFAKAILAFVQQHQLEKIARIGLHGLTLWHQAETVRVFGEDQRGTLQIGDPYIVAQATGVTVVHDFRNADMALGGEGAPLAPFLDVLLFAAKEEHRILLNLGGIANATFIPAGSRAPIAFDTGPASMIIDALMAQHPTQPARYDDGGQCAARGKVLPDLLQRCLDHPYFSQPIPKTTGRELFGAPFLRYFSDYPDTHDYNDLVATATALTAHSIANAIVEVQQQQGIGYQRIIAAGGGTHNATLLAQLSAALPQQMLIETTAQHGIDPDTKEAVLFAALAWANAQGIAANFPSVSGATHAAILGSSYTPLIK